MAVEKDFLFLRLLKMQRPLLRVKAEGGPPAFGGFYQSVYKLRRKNLLMEGTGPPSAKGEIPPPSPKDKWSFGVTLPLESCLEKCLSQILAQESELRMESSEAEGRPGL